jgi:hypothetical protein
VRVLDRLVERGDTLVIVEHHPDVIANADGGVELGPEAGEKRTRSRRGSSSRTPRADNAFLLAASGVGDGTYRKLRPPFARISMKSSRPPRRPTRATPRDADDIVVRALAQPRRARILTRP